MRHASSIACVHSHSLVGLGYEDVCFGPETGVGRVGQQDLAALLVQIRLSAS
jgi:hypothetical protein